MDKLNLSTTDMISLVIWLIVLVGVVHWGHTFRTKKRDMVRIRKYYYIVSGIMLAIAIGGLAFKGLNFGLDFTGGTVVEVGAPQKLSVGAAEISSMITSANPNYEVSVQLGQEMEAAADGKQYQKILVRAKLTGGNAVELQPEQTKALVAGLQKDLNVGELLTLSETSIGPTVSGELKSGALLALLVALCCQLVYITFRFGQQLRFGLAADIALAHDSIIMIGFYALAGLTVDSSFVAALLTVAGYSVMDSVVIFDRVREHMHRETAPFAELVNRSINDTMTRSVNTTLTTVIVCIALYFFGGVTLKGFAFALLVGICTGAYSSVFLAGPMLVDMDNFAQKRDAARAEEMRLAAEERARERQGGAAKSGDSKTESETPAAKSAPAGGASSARSRRRVKGVRRSF